MNNQGPARYKGNSHYNSNKRKKYFQEGKQKQFGHYRSHYKTRDQFHKRQSNWEQFQNEFEAENERNSQQKIQKETQVRSQEVRSEILQTRDEANIEQITTSQSQASSRLNSLAQEFLQEIQNLDYKKLNFYQLEQQFKEIVRGHVYFRGIYPQSQSDLGKFFIANGLFHEMWGNVLLKSKENHNFWLYYQKYQNLLNSNHSNFESMFNSVNSLSSQTTESPHCEEDTNSNTNLFSKQKKIPQQRFTPSLLNIIKEDRFREDNSENENVSHQTIQINFSSKENCVPSQNNITVEMRQKGRLRIFGLVQTNQRKLNTEIILYFLGITKVYRLQRVHFSKILQALLTNQAQIVVLQGQVEAYCQQMNRLVVDYIPKLLLIAYGEVNLATLLRLQNSYGKIEGLVVYDELIDIKKWLRGNGHLNEEEF